MNKLLKYIFIITIFFTSSALAKESFFEEAIILYEEGKIKDVLIGKRWQNNDFMSLNNINDFGNYIINKFFNKVYNTNFSDILCCLKIIKKTHLENLNLTSNGFSIESEIMSKLVIEKRSISEVNIAYNRRSIEQGKKLKMFHGIDIILTIIKNKIF